jgi:hypothetical protein
MALLTGAAAIVLAGFAGIADAQTPAETHVMTLRLPGGQVEQVRYTGNVAPTVILAPDPAFALLQRMSADMDRQAAALLQDIDAVPAPDAGGFGIIPAMSGPGVCMRSVQITYSGDGRAPHVVSRTAGDCGSARASATPTTLPSAPVREEAPAIVQAKADTPYLGLVHPVGDWQR